MTEEMIKGLSTVRLLLAVESNTLHCSRNFRLSSLISKACNLRLFSYDTTDLSINFLNSPIFLDLYKI